MSRAHSVRDARVYSVRIACIRMMTIRLNYFRNYTMAISAMLLSTCADRYTRLLRAD